MHGEPCWESVERRYDDPDDRWIIEMPTDRGSIMSGPTSVAVDQWMLWRMSNANTGVCAPFEWRVVDPFGNPLPRLPVWISGPFGFPILRQERTDADGRITVLGAHDGDLIVARSHWAQGN